MVLKDPFFDSEWNWHKSKKKSKKGPSQLNLASPIDRLAATIVDLIILIPLLSLALAFFKRQIYLTQLLGTQPELYFLVLLYFVFMVFIQIVYQATFISAIGATPGKFFFGLKVCDVWTERCPHWQKAVMRSCLWWFDVVTLLPLFALYTDSRRRPFHDRFVDTIVVAKGSRSVGRPGIAETNMARGFFAALLLFASLVIIARVQMLYQTASKNGISLQEWVGGSGTCEAVTEALKNWPIEVKIPRSSQRLAVALALYTAEEIGQDCLDQEADRLLWNTHASQQEKALGYLAKGFNRLSYLEKVCQLSTVSEACEMSQLVFSWEQEDNQVVNSLVAKIQEKSSIYTKIWAIRHFYHQAQLNEVLMLVKQISPNFALSTFLEEVTIKSKWFMDHKSQANLLFLSFWQTRYQADRLNLASWLCYENLAKSCHSVNEPSCKVLEKETEKREKSLMRPSISLAHYRVKECRAGKVGGFGYANKYIMPEEVKQYLEVLTASQSSRPTAVFSHLSRFTKNRSMNSAIRQDAFLRMAKAADSSGELINVYMKWRDKEEIHDWLWYRIGESLFDGFYRFKDYQLAIRVGQHLYKWRPSLKKNLNRLVIAHNSKGDRRTAWALLKDYKKLSNQERMPAADGSGQFDTTVRELEIEFGRK